MSPAPRVSLIIVSRDRPAELGRLLSSLRFLQYPEFEVIAVTRNDPAQSHAEIPHVARVRHIAFDDSNISAARNLGLAAAAGDIIAFCDDDAVPEPSWLDHLTAPFADPHVGAAGGYVRGRNGISFQWRGRAIDCWGNASDLPLAGDKPELFAPAPGQAIKTEGTNCAFRREALVAIGGFDENFRYFLDETDVNWRLAQAGWKTAIVPLAQVHHGFAANAARRSDRAPKTLFDIGASKAWFCRKHGTAEGLEAEIGAFRAAQRRRLIEFMLSGRIDPFAIESIMKTLDAGIEAGLRFTPCAERDFSAPQEFQGFRQEARKPRLYWLACRPLGWPRTRRRAEALAQRGDCATVFRLSPSTLYHRVRYSAEGYWLQTGGVFGRALRNEPLFRWHTLTSRSRQERARLAQVRPMVSPDSEPTRS